MPAGNGRGAAGGEATGKWTDGDADEAGHDVEAAGVSADGDTFDRMRKALGDCSFLPAHPDKRFARSVAMMPLDRITERQRRHVSRLAWKYRRTMPRDLVPSKDAVRAIDAGWHEETVAGLTVMTTK